MRSLVLAVVLGATGPVVAAGAATITVPPQLHPGHSVLVNGSGFQRPGAAAFLEMVPTDRRREHGFPIEASGVVDSQGDVSIRFHLPRTFSGCFPYPNCSTYLQALFLPGESLSVTLWQIDSADDGVVGGPDYDWTNLQAPTRVSSHYRLPQARLAAFAGQRSQRKPRALKLGRGRATGLRWAAWGEQQATATGAYASRSCSSGCGVRVRVDQLLVCRRRVTYQRIRFRVGDGAWREIQRGSLCPRGR
jgi:hypothetical protein